MGALSSKDKLKLRLSDARIERWNRERHKPVDNDKARCHGLEANKFTGEKPLEDVKPDKVLDSIHRSTDGYSIRTMASKLGKHGNAIAARVHTITHTDKTSGIVTTQVVYDCPENDPAPHDPAFKAMASKVVKPRDSDNVFKAYGAKKAQARIASGALVIERKGR